MKRSTVSHGALAVLVLLPLLPVCGFVLNAAPEVVFFIGAIAFLFALLLLIFTAGAMALADPPPVAKRFHFTIRHLLYLTAVLFGMTMFILSGFKCEAAERASRPNPLPAVAYRQFVWEMEAGLICFTIGGLLWIDPFSSRWGKRD
jgi:hypothetical protein